MSHQAIQRRLPLPLLGSIHPTRRLAFTNRQISTSRTTQEVTKSVATTAEAPEKTVVIIGGGLSGLSSAFFLHRSLPLQFRSKTRIVVLEKEKRLGGWCRSIKVPLKEMGLDTDGTAVFETGPRSIRPVGLQGWLTIEMAHAIGLTSSLLTVSKTAPSAKNRYLFYPSSLTLLPSSLLSSLQAAFTNPVIRPTIPGILLEPFRHKSPLHSQTGGDESVDSFFRRRFGKPLAENMISAMIHGIYAGDTRRLSIKAIFPGLWDAEKRSGSLIRSMLRKGKKSRYQLEGEKDEREVVLIKERMKRTEGGPDLVEKMEKASVWGVKGGLEELTNGLARYLVERGVEVRTGTTWNLGDNFDVSTPQERLFPTHLVTTNPSTLPTALEMPTIPSTTVSVVNLCYLTDSPLFPPGFGYLIPRTVSKEMNPHHVLGVIFDSDVMPGVDDTDAPLFDGKKLIKITMILGGSYWLPPSDELPKPFPPSHTTLLEFATSTLRLHFPQAELPEPIYSLSHTHINCIPQVPPGLGTALELFGQNLATASKGRVRVAVVGGGTSSVGVNGAVKAAWEVGESFARDLAGTGMAKTGLEGWQLTDRTVD